MEERLALEWCDLDHRLPSWGELLADSILGGSTLTPLHVDAEIAYQVTTPPVPLRVRKRVPATGSVASDRTAPAPDLRPPRCFLRQAALGSRRRSCCCAGTVWRLRHARVSARREAFLAQQADDASFPPPELAPDPSPPHEHPPEDHHRRRFLGRYHTTLVAILACLRHGRRVEARAAPTVQAGAEYPDPYARSTRGQHAQSEGRRAEGRDLAQQASRRHGRLGGQPTARSRAAFSSGFGSAAPSLPTLRPRWRGGRPACERRFSVSTPGRTCRRRCPSS